MDFKQLEKERKEKEEKQRLEQEKKMEEEKKQEEARHRITQSRNTTAEYCRKMELFGHDIDILLTQLSIDDLEKLNHLYESQKDPKQARKIFQEKIEMLNKKQKEVMAEKEEEMRKKYQKEQKPWTEPELVMLSKALQKFPTGTPGRWDKIANMIGTRSAKEVIAQSKKTNSQPSSKPNVVLQDAFERFTLKQTSKKKAQEPNIVLDKNENEGIPPDGWNPEEQKALEMALKKYPASDKERWDKIAQDVKTRDRKECIARYKFLVNQIKAQKGK